MTLEKTTFQLASLAKTVQFVQKWLFCAVGLVQMFFYVRFYVRFLQHCLIELSAPAETGCFASFSSLCDTVLK